MKKNKVRQSQTSWEWDAVRVIAYSGAKRWNYYPNLYLVNIKKLYRTST